MSRTPDPASLLTASSYRASHAHRPVERAPRGGALLRVYMAGQGVFFNSLQPYGRWCWTGGVLQRNTGAAGRAAVAARHLYKSKANARLHTQQRLKKRVIRVRQASPGALVVLLRG